MAAQVVPLMAEREMITMIMDMLSVFYYEKMVGYMPVSFADLVFAGEWIEVSLKKGKFDYAASMNSSSLRPEMNGVKKKEKEAHVVVVVPTCANFSQTPYNPMYKYPPHQYHFSTNINPPPYPIPLRPIAPNHPQNPPLCSLDQTLLPIPT